MNALKEKATSAKTATDLSPAGRAARQRTKVSRAQSAKAQGRPASEGAPRQARPGPSRSKPLGRLHPPKLISPLPAQAPAPPPACPEPPAATTHPPEQQAAILWRAVLPSLMTTAVGVEGQVGASGCRVLLDRLVENAGGPADSVEVMLIEQLTMAHYRAAKLQAQAAEAKSLEAAQVYNTAAARLLAEFRKTALALQEYRARALALQERGAAQTRQRHEENNGHQTGK